MADTQVTRGCCPCFPTWNYVKSQSHHSSPKMGKKPQRVTAARQNWSLRKKLCRWIEKKNSSCTLGFWARFTPWLHRARCSPEALLCTPKPESSQEGWFLEPSAWASWHTRLVDRCCTKKDLCGQISLKHAGLKKVKARQQFTLLRRDPNHVSSIKSRGSLRSNLQQAP